MSAAGSGRSEESSKLSSIITMLLDMLDVKVVEVGESNCWSAVEQLDR